MEKIDFVLKNIKEKRQTSGMRLIDVCAEYELITGTPITENAIHMWETGKRHLTVENLLVLAQIYGCSPAVLLDEPCMHRDEDILADFSALPDNEKIILRYMLRDWDGDPHALINYIGAYMSMDEHNRLRMSRYGIKVIDSQKADLPYVDEDKLHKGLDILKKKG